ncbi:MAG: hypothetical protein IT359_08710 [Gemmatimonadaceae bacterium]|nr:hypothetical protein [Gemmatimonadaceae bacterium]
MENSRWHDDEPLRNWKLHADHVRADPDVQDCHQTVGRDAREGAREWRMEGQVRNDHGDTSQAQTDRRSRRDSIGRSRDLHRHGDTDYHRLVGAELGLETGRGNGRNQLQLPMDGQPVHADDLEVGVDEGYDEL